MLQLPAWIDSAFVWLFFKAHHPEGEPEAAPKVARSAFLEGAREAGGTKTYSGAIAKQKTAVPQGAASLSLAVLESDGRKGKWRQTVS